MRNDGARARFVRSQEAVTQVYGFMVAGIVFIAALGSILVFTRFEGQDPGPAEQAAMDVDADDLASLLIGTPGSGWATPNTLAALGLADATGLGLNASHLGLLNNATLSSVPNNGLIEYDEARALLGLSNDAGFQMRLRPIDFTSSLQDYDLSHIKALYIGDFGNIGTITLGVGQGTMANGQVALNNTMATNTGLERTAIDSIGVEFDNEVHMTVGSPAVLVQITTTPNVKSPLLTVLGLPLWDGDVLFDDKQYLDAVLPGKLATGGYDLLVLGSGIDHSTLTANAVKSAVNTFVRNGGTLMVFGSPGANFNWMQPILDVSAVAVSGAVTAPDATHPILTTPWPLDWTHYNTNNLGWTVGVPANFDNVLVQGGKPVIAVSHPNTIGSGMVFLSSIQPRAVAASLGGTEATHYMFNLLLYNQQAPDDPTLVFGPDPPAGVPVSSSVRTTVVQDGETQINAVIELLAWSTP